MDEGQSAERLRTDVSAVSIAISRVARQSEKVLASAMLASWSETLGAIEAANALADTGLEPQRHYMTVFFSSWWTAARVLLLEPSDVVGWASLGWFEAAPGAVPSLCCLRTTT